MIRDPTGSYTPVFHAEGVVPSLHPCAQKQISPILDQSLVRFAVPELRTMARAAPVDLRKARLPSIAARGGGGMEP
jgi:hypothetical protein